MHCKASKSTRLQLMITAYLSKRRVTAVHSNVVAEWTSSTVSSELEDSVTTGRTELEVGVAELNTVEWLETGDQLGPVTPHRY